MIKKLLTNRVASICLLILGAFTLAGIFAPVIAPHDPNLSDFTKFFAPISWEFPLGADHLGRCILSRLIFGIRTTLFYAFFTMVITLSVSTVIGIISGNIGGKLDNFIMRTCDILLSFPSEVMVLCLIGILGPGITSIIIANFIAKLPWYVRMIRSSVIRFNHQNYVLYSNTIETRFRYKLFRHFFPNIASEVAILASMDIGWVILSISTLSFLGLGVALPTPEWGAMLSEAKDVLLTNPEQMMYPGVTIMIVVATCNLLGDSMRELFDPKELA